MAEEKRLFIEKTNQLIDVLDDFKHIKFSEPPEYISEEFLKQIREYQEEYDEKMKELKELAKEFGNNIKKCGNLTIDLHERAKKNPYLEMSSLTPVTKELFDKTNEALDQVGAITVEQNNLLIKAAKTYAEFEEHIARYEEEIRMLKKKVESLQKQPKEKTSPPVEKIRVEQDTFEQLKEITTEPEEQEEQEPSEPLSVEEAPEPKPPIQPEPEICCKFEDIDMQKRMHEAILNLAITFKQSLTQSIRTPMERALLQAKALKKDLCQKHMLQYSYEMERDGIPESIIGVEIAIAEKKDPSSVDKRIADLKKKVEEIRAKKYGDAA